MSQLWKIFLFLVCVIISGICLAGNISGASEVEAYQALREADLSIQARVQASELNYFCDSCASCLEIQRRCDAGGIEVWVPSNIFLCARVRRAYVPHYCKAR